MSKFDIIESIILKNTLRDAWKYRIKISIAIILLAIGGGIIGFTQGKLLPKSSEWREVAAYEETLNRYDAIMEETRNNLNIAKEQMQKQQEYMDKSPYMKIDPQKQQWGELSYNIDSDYRSEDIIQSYNNFVNRGWLAKELSKKYKDEPAEYIKDGIWSSNNGNMWTVTIIRMDEKQIQELLPLVKEAVDSYKKEIKFEHRITLTKQINYVGADQNTFKQQNEYRDTLRKFSNDVVNYSKQLVDTQKQKDNYARMYKPKKYNVKNPAKAAGNFAGFGALLGLIVPLAYFSLKSIMSNKFTSIDSLQGLSIPILGFASRNSISPPMDRTMAEIDLLSQKRGVNKIYLGRLLDDNSDEIIERYTNELVARMTVIIGKDITNDAEELREFGSCGATIALVKLGETGYTDVENYLNMCKKFGIDVWGFIVIE